MKRFLLFELYGPMASWGEIAVGEIRPTENRPTKAAILGIIAACLGVRRTDHEENFRLSTDYGFATKTLSFGEYRRDYHTVQMPSRSSKQWWKTRADEVRGVPRCELNTLLSKREYRENSNCIVAIWLRSDDTPRFSLEEIQKALKNPYFIPYLGRKSCPIGRPFHPQIIEGESLKLVLDKYHFDLPEVSRDSVSAYAWDEFAEHGMPEPEKILVFRRYDSPIGTRERRVFEERMEFFYIAEEL